jgi:Protein of unknown function (DUF2971)
MPDVLYHYTGFSGFEGILRSRELWATDIQFLNDSQEFHFAHSEVLKEIDRQIVGADPQTSMELSHIRRLLSFAGVGSSYIVSFTRGNDKLSLWRGYSRTGGGVSLGFSRRWIEQQLGQFRLVQCLYEQSEQQRAIQTMLETCMEEIARDRSSNSTQPANREMLFGGDAQIFVRDQFLRLAPRLKHPKFEEEDEWRLVLTSRGQSPADLRTRIGANTLIPYSAYPLGGRRLGADTSALIHFDGLHSVLVGPNSHPEHLLIKAVQDAFGAHGLSRHHLSIGCSRIPFRSVV